MKILDVHVYRDGGTMVIITDHGNFWIAKPGSEDRWPRKKEEDGEKVSPGQLLDLLEGLASDSSRFHWVKNHLNN
jgi:hypothetical protein